jgi:hypothetical protein
MSSTVLTGSKSNGNTTMAPQTRARAEARTQVVTYMRIYNYRDIITAKTGMSVGFHKSLGSYSKNKKSFLRFKLAGLLCLTSFRRNK